MRILWAVQTVDFIDPIGMMLISALAKGRGHQCELVVLSREDILARIARFQPQVVAYSACTGEHKYYLQANKAIKDRFPDIFTIMGGPHPTFYPECLQEGTLDAICMGEGEGAFSEALEALEAGKGVSGILNIATRSGNGHHLRPLYEDLDRLPFPDRELFYQNTEMGRFPLKSFMASRGCPYPCTYCFNHAFRGLYQGQGRLLRRHSVDYVLEEVQRVKMAYALECVKFYDDIFVYRVDGWFEEFVNKYPRRIGLPFHCLTRADLVTEDLVKLLKEAGCYSISMSIEAGNPSFRNGVLKRGMSNEQIVQAFDLCRRYGIHTFSNNILGLPFARREHEIETLDLNLKARVSYAEFPIFHPYPRTELGDYCLKMGIFQPQYDGLHLSYMNKSPLSCFSEKEKNFQRNLSTLGLLVVWFPWLRGVVLRFLVHLPYNRFYFFLYWLAKVYLVRTRVYPLRLRPRDLGAMVRKSLGLESFKKSDERRAWARKV